MQEHKAEEFISLVTDWAKREPEIVGLLLVGSYAHGKANPDSDIDLIAFANDINPWLERRDWVNNFGKLRQIEYEDWVGVKTIRAFFTNSFEVEFSFALPSWAATNPVDPGTFRVISDGSRILLDPQGFLSKLLRAVECNKVY